MALLFCDSFSHYLIADLTKKWTASSSTSVLLPDYGSRPASTGILLGGNSTNIYKTIANTVTFIGGGMFQTGSLANASPIFGFYQSATEHVSVRYTTGGNLTFTRNGTVLATSTNTISTATWYHIEVKCTIDNSAGAYEVRVNGTATNWIPAATSQDTQNGGSALINEFRIFSRATNSTDTFNHRYSDVYICDTSGSVANDFLGQVRIAVLRPDSAGNYQDWTPNHADNFVNVSDFVMDTDTTFNQTATAGDIDTYNLDTLPAGTVHAVQHVITARQDSGSGRTIRPITRISTTDYNGTTVATGASHVMFLEPRSISPATSAQWTASEINGAEFGYERVS